MLPLCPTDSGVSIAKDVTSVVQKTTANIQAMAWNLQTYAWQGREIQIDILVTKGPKWYSLKKEFRPFITGMSNVKGFCLLYHLMNENLK